MSMADRIESKLTEAFAPSQLEIKDQSYLHAGHTGARPGGETHFHVTMVSDRFAGQNRVARQRSVYAVLSDELAERVHALQLTLRTPDEVA